MSLYSRKSFKVLPVVPVPPIDASDGVYRVSRSVIASWMSTRLWPRSRALRGIDSTPPLVAMPIRESLHSD
jgi:hypothetical protein